MVKTARGRILLKTLILIIKPEINNAAKALILSKGNSSSEYQQYFQKKKINMNLVSFFILSN